MTEKSRLHSSHHPLGFEVTSPWWWRLHNPLKHWYPITSLHSFTSQKTMTCFWCFILAYPRWVSS